MPLPGSKPKSRARDTSSKTPLSQEIIEDDDDSVSENKPQSKTATKPKTTIAIHRPNGATSSRSKSGSKGAETPKPAHPSKASSKKSQSKQTAIEQQIARSSDSEPTDDSQDLADHNQTEIARNEQEKDASSENENDSDSDNDSSSSSDVSDVANTPQPSRQATQE